MDNDRPIDETAVQAMDLATLLLQVCEKSGLPANIYQASLAGAWIRICSHLEFPLEAFQDMALLLIFEYRTIWEKRNEGKSNGTRRDDK